MQCVSKQLRHRIDLIFWRVLCLEKRMVTNVVVANAVFIGFLHSLAFADSALIKLTFNIGLSEISNPQTNSNSILLSYVVRTVLQHLTRLKNVCQLNHNVR